MTRPSHIRLVALDMAGTTVTDDGVVGDAFTQAVTAMGVDTVSQLIDLLEQDEPIA